MKKIAVALLALALFALLFGCTQQQAEQVQNIVSDNNSNTNTQVSQGTQTQGTQADNSTNTSDDTFLGFKTAISALPIYYAAYDLVSGSTTAKTKTWVKVDKFRQDATIQGYDSSTYFIDNKVTVCTNASGSTMCFESSSKPSDNGTSDVKNHIDSLEGKIERLPDKLVAGVTASCYKINDTNYNYSYCYSPDYVPLYVEFDSNGSVTTLTATEYSKTVDDSVFVIPASSQTTQYPSYPGYGG